jgi:Tol biopolymer transport system component
MTSTPTGNFPGAGRAMLLAVLLVGLGFALGMGFQTLQYAQQQQRGAPTQKNQSQTDGTPRPPLVRDLRVSPDDGLLAFSAIYTNAQNEKQAGRFIFDLETYQWSEAKTPDGWQDSITQWSRDGKRILFARERIPRPAGKGAAGLYEEKIARPQKSKTRNEAQPLSEDVPTGGEKVYAGFWTPRGELVMKTRREAKSLFLKQGDEAQLIDRSPGTYYQNRAVLENGKRAYYVVRDVSIEDGEVALFRIQNEGQNNDGQNNSTRRIGSTLRDVIWAYLSEDARRLLVCRFAENGTDWQWSLYQVTPQKMQLQQQAMVPADVIAVYWSPDFKTILGAAGKSLWLIDIPSLQTRKLGNRDDWNADDAAWLTKEKAVLVAAAGQLWKVDMTTGRRREVWKFPANYWQR